MLAHGRAVAAFRASGRTGEIGITNANSSFEPADDSPETAVAVERARDFDTRTFHGPVFGQGYPASVLKYYAERGAPLPIQPGDMAAIAAPTDFLGVNLYSRQLIEPDAGDRGFRTAPPRLPLLPMGYEAAPHSLGDFVRWVSAEYGRPRIYITENGVGDNTTPGPDGTVDDRQRIELLGGFLQGLYAAIEAGCDVRAYYQWSLMDNFEWPHGYAMRFGMVWTDFETLRRIPKASASWYSEVIRRNGVEV
jgi:beta-glucosidase